MQCPSKVYFPLNCLKLSCFIRLTSMQRPGIKSVALNTAKKPIYCVRKRYCEFVEDLDESVVK